MALSIELSEEIQEHFERCRRLVEEADDEMSEDSLASRATAMRSFTSLLQDLLVMQKEAHNLQSLMTIETSLIEVARDNFDDEQLDRFLDDLEVRLSKVAK